MSEQKRSILHSELEYLGAQFSPSTEGFNFAESFFGEKPFEVRWIVWLQQIVWR